jgi:hypothetical protein
MDGSERDKWFEAVRGELMNFYSRNAWTHLVKSKVLAAGHNIVGTKSVFHSLQSQDCNEGLHIYTWQSLH